MGDLALRPGPEGPPAWWKQVLALLLVASMGLAGLALTMQVADFDVDTRVGIVDFKLDTDWKAGSVTYTGSASGFGVEVDDKQVLLEGTGDFQEAVGFLKGTAKRVTNSITPFTTGATGVGGRATLNVTAGTETIPWWVVGVSTPCLVEVELIESKNVSSLTIDRVYLELRREVDGETLKKMAWEKEVSDVLANVGDKRTYETDLEVSEDWGEFQIFGMVEVTMVDTDGSTATQMLKSYYNDPKVITIWTIPTGDGVRIALLIAAMPVYLFGLVFAAGGLVAVFLDKRGRLVLPLTGGVLLLLGALFFMLGVSQLAELVGYPDDLSYTAGYYIMLIGSVPAILAGAMVGYQRARFEGDEDGDADDEGAGDPGPTGEDQEVPSAENTITDEDTVSQEDGE